MIKKGFFVSILLVTCFIVYPAANAESPRNISYIAIGDSLTAGYGSTEHNYLRINGFVPQFVSYLRKTHEVTVENYGIPGISSIGLLTYLQTDIGLQNRLKEADIITLSIGGNDFLQTIRAMSNVEERELKQRALLLEQTYDTLYAFLRDLNKEAQIYLIGLYNPYPANHPLREPGIKYAEAFNEQLEKHSKKENTFLINPLQAFLNKETTYTHIKEDDIHPTDEGYTIIVKELIKQYEAHNQE